MEVLKKDKMMKFHPNTLEAVRKEVNLEKVSRIQESLNILEEWLNKQTHFCKRDFSRDYLERTLIINKGSVERTKERLDKLCTFRTLMPEFFTISANSKKDFEDVMNMVLTAHMPVMTPEHNRLYVIKLVSDNIESNLVANYFKYLTVLCEYQKKVDYNTGVVSVIDFRELSSIMSFITKISPIDLRKCMTLITEGYGFRVKGMHLLTSSKLVDTLLNFFKQIVSPKLGDRIYVHKDVESLYKFFPKKIFPADYGGDEKPLKDKNQEWIEQVTSKEFVDYIQEMYSAKTNEAFRQENSFNEHYVGMTGSFRALSVD